MNKEGYTMTNTAVVVHINEELSKEGRDNLSDNVCKLSGVVSAELRDQRPHLMIVDYDCTSTKSLHVLDGVKQNGVHAQLVGWL
jgi:hypothetical protein